MYNQIIILTIIGFLLSFYAYYIVKQNKKHKKYNPLCNINDRVSCTKVLSSSYGRLFKIHNSVIGLIFYLIIIILALMNNLELIFYISILSVIGSAYLAYLSYVKLKTFCIVCTAIYLVNLSLLIISYKLL